MGKKKCTGDPGHGGRDPGAVGPSGTKEANVTLAVTRKVAAYLSPVIDFSFTRNSDVSLGNNLNADLAARVKIANKADSDVFVSVHCNSAADASAHGAEIYTTPGETQADPLATSILNRMEAALPELKFRKDLADGDPDKEAGFYVIKYTKMPAVLVELAFISNPAEEALLQSEDFQNRAAKAIAQGICDFLGVELPVPESALVEQQAGPEQWKLDIIEDAKKFGLITGDHDPDEPAPKWFVLKVALNTLKESSLV